MIERHVVNSELSKKLKELGVKQESYFHWGNPPFAKDGFNILHFDEWQDSAKCGYDTYSAFLASELGEMLPETIDHPAQLCKFKLYINKFRGDWHIGYRCEEHNGKHGTQSFGGKYPLADSMAEMRICLIENNLSAS